MFLRYEATFAGLLSAIAHGLRAGHDPMMMIPDLDQPTLLPCEDIVTEPGIQRLFRAHLRSVLGGVSGPEVFDQAYAAFLSDDEGIGLSIHRYLKAALRGRCDPAGNLLDPDIARVVHAAQAVRRQAHVFLGLIRFRKVAQSLFLADFRPDYHVLPLILPHFCERLPDQPFVIRDLRRDLAALHIPGKPVSVFALVPGGPALDADGTQAPEASDPFDALWRQYLRNVTIPERRNLELQRVNLPKKYWKYLTEQPGQT